MSRWSSKTKGLPRQAVPLLLLRFFMSGIIFDLGFGVGAPVVKKTLVAALAVSSWVIEIGKAYSSISAAVMSAWGRTQMPQAA
eukprot:1139492-Pelagomonas_calceolata.AAC.6